MSLAPGAEIPGYRITGTVGRGHGFGLVLGKGAQQRLPLREDAVIEA